MNSTGGDRPSSAGDRPCVAGHVVSVGALAGGALLLESALLRLLSVAQFYHFAFLVVSLALLGFGASGSLLSLFPGWRETPLDRLFAWMGAGFAGSVILAYAVVNWLPFDSYSIAWDPRQVALFVLYYFVLALPFLFSGLAIAAGLAGAPGGSHRVYAANLLGSGGGVVLALGLLEFAGVPGAVLGAVVLGLGVSAGTSRSRLLALLVTLGLVGLGWMSFRNLRGDLPLGLTLSPYKGLSYARQYPGSQHEYGRWSAISRVDVMSAAGTRQLPGLSYAYPENPPAQLGLSVDASTLQPITLVSPETFTAAPFLPEALAYRLRPGGRALVLEPAGGLGVLQALAGGAEGVVAVVGDDLIVDAVRQSVPAVDPYDWPDVELVREETRVYLSRRPGPFDVVSLPLTDGYRPITSGAYSLGEEYSLTVEAFAAMLRAVAPDGLLVTTRWTQTPPSESVRLMATLIEVLEAEGQVAPQDAIVAYRGVQTLTALVQKEGWQDGELELVRAFLENRRFDLVWAPDVRPEEVNRFNVLPEPQFYEIAADLLTASARDSFFEAYPFAARPARDDHPFFFHFFTFGQTPDVLATYGRTWQPFGGSGFLVLIAMLGLAVVLSALLILAPLLARTGSLRTAAAPRGAVIAYFTFLGFAFLLVEIPLIQRWILLLGHPAYAFSAVVLVLLAFSSLGSLRAHALYPRRNALMGLLVLLALLTPWGVSALIAGTLGLPLVARTLVVALSLAPLSFLMGLPFPWGLIWLEARAPESVPWAWAINGSASVIAAVLAAILALSAGFTLVLLMGAGAYALAWGLGWTWGEGAAEAAGLTPPPG